MNDRIYVGFDGSRDDSQFVYTHHIAGPHVAADGATRYYFYEPTAPRSSATFLMTGAPVVDVEDGVPVYGITELD